MAGPDGGVATVSGVDMVMSGGGRLVEAWGNAHRIYPEGVSFSHICHRGSVAMAMGNAGGAGIRGHVFADGVL